VFTAQFDGWRCFCSEFQIDPDLLMNDRRGYETVKPTDEPSAWMRVRR
jgi:hypothetical protein